MKESITVGVYKCDMVSAVDAPFDYVDYMIYPAVELLEQDWLQEMSRLAGAPLVVVYIPADLWNDSLTPWPEPGETHDARPFEGKASAFLKEFTESILPAVEKNMEWKSGIRRNLIGVSLSGLFTLWQWMQHATFESIACLSGSFWYAGFIEWFESLPVPKKSGKAFFLLGDKEPQSHIKAFRSVGDNTLKIVERLKENGIDTEFKWVDGNHFTDPLGRAKMAISKLSQR